MRPAPVEIALQPRYRSAPSGRWPIMVAPCPDEWLPGWLIRFGAANGVPARVLGALLNLGPGKWALNIERDLSPAIATDIETASGLSAAMLLALVRPRTDQILTLVILPRSARSLPARPATRICAQRPPCGRARQLCASR